MDKFIDLIKEIFDNGIQKLLAVVFIPVLPIFALFGEFNATGNYWWDLVIAFGITGVFVLVIWIIVKNKN